MINIVTQFKETDAYKDLQSKICNEIAGVFLGRLKEIGVADSQLQQVSDDIGYDIASAMSEIGSYEIPGADHFLDALEEKNRKIASLEAMVKQVVALEAKVNEITARKVKVKQMAAQEAKANNMAILEERTDKNIALEEGMKDRPLPRVEGVLSQDKILSILNAAKTASA